jgi:beta-mannanase
MRSTKIYNATPHEAFRPLSHVTRSNHRKGKYTRARTFTLVASFFLACGVGGAFLGGLGGTLGMKPTFLPSRNTSDELAPLAATVKSIVTAILATTTTTSPPPTTTTTSSPPTTTTTSSPPTTTTTSSPPTTTTSAAPTSLLEGAYVGAADPSGITAFDAATETTSTIASDYLPGSDGWSGMDGTGGSISWLSNAWKGTGYTLSLGVPIIPTDSSGNPVGTLATGATGAYNSYFVTLAQTLVSAGESNAFLRLGWEFDGSGYAWGATTSAAEANYAAYFQQIATAMRSVPGESFRFVWNPDAGAFTTSGYNIALAYPGNAFVDVIGIDDYDFSWDTPQTPSNTWNETTLPALTAAQEFASARGKPLAVDEWGVATRSDGHGLGDDPLFVNNFTAWMKDPSNDVIYESYFNVDYGDGNSTDITGGDFPNSLAAYTSDLG